jgi:hypothetical protein
VLDEFEFTRVVAVTVLRNAGDVWRRDDAADDADGPLGGLEWYGTGRRRKPMNYTGAAIATQVDEEDPLMSASRLRTISLSLDSGMGLPAVYLMVPGNIVIWFLNAAK